MTYSDLVVDEYERDGVSSLIANMVHNNMKHFLYNSIEPRRPTGLSKMDMPSPIKAKYQEVLHRLIPPQRGVVTTGTLFDGEVAVNELQELGYYLVSCALHIDEVRYELWYNDVDLSQILFGTNSLVTKLRTPSRTKITKRLARYLLEYGLTPDSHTTQLLIQYYVAQQQLKTERKLYYRVVTHPREMYLLGETVCDAGSCFGTAGENSHHTDFLIWGLPSAVVLAGHNPLFMEENLDPHTICTNTLFRYWMVLLPHSSPADKSKDEDFHIYSSNPYIHSTIDYANQDRMHNALQKYLLRDTKYESLRQGDTLRIGLYGNEGKSMVWGIKDEQAFDRSLQSRQLVSCPMCSEGWKLRRPDGIGAVGEGSREVCCSGHANHMHHNPSHRCIGCGIPTERGTHNRAGVRQNRCDIYLSTPLPSQKAYTRRIILCTNCKGAIYKHPTREVFACKRCDHLVAPYALSHKPHPDVLEAAAQKYCVSCMKGATYATAG